MARGVDGRDIFADDSDRSLFLRRLSELKMESGFSLLGYCLMGNHFHLAIKVAHTPLSNITQRLLTQYALTFNARYGRTGHLFQARYKAILCVDERYLLRLVDYIHANPVRSGLVTKATDWEWSSARIYAEKSKTPLIDPSELPAVLGLDSNHEIFDPWQDHKEPVLLRLPAAPDVSVDALAESISRSFGLSAGELRSKRRKPENVNARRAFVSECLKNGCSLSEIARWLNCTPAAVHYLASKR